MLRVCSDWIIFLLNINDSFLFSFLVENVFQYTLLTFFIFGQYNEMASKQKQKQRLIHICFFYAVFLELVGLDWIYPLHTSKITNVSVQIWLKDYFIFCLNNEDQSLDILQSMFTVLWLIWNHRNKVFHQGFNPNPLEVILIAKNLSCKYRKSYAGQLHHIRESRATKSAHLTTAGHQLIIKLAAARRKKPQRRAYAFCSCKYAGNKNVFRG